jgi:hypothetical protein
MQLALLCTHDKRVEEVDEGISRDISSTLPKQLGHMLVNFSQVHHARVL